MPCLCFCCAPPGAQFGATAKLCLPPSFSTRGFLHECLWVGIVVKAVRADHHIKGPRFKGQMLAVPHQEFGVGKVLRLRRLDHAGRQINSGTAFVRKFLQQKLDHRAGSAANIQQRLKRISVQFFQNGRVIVLAHLIQSRMAGIIDFCRFGEFPDGHGLVFLFAHAEWAWVPHGDTCPFCIMLASNGWQKASAKLLKGGHASHIHANCDCEFAVRFDGSTSVAGYDPEKYLKQYRAAGSDVNAWRRIDYAARKDAINAQKRAAYAVRKLDFMGAPKDFSDSKGIVSVKAYQVKGHATFFTQTNTKDAQKTIQFILDKSAEIQQLQTVPEIIVAKDLPGIAAYDHVDNRLYVNERISNADFIKEQLSGSYFVAENAEDILRHEMHHKDHWDYIGAKALTTGKSNDTVKQEIEADLREYVQHQLASDPKYVRNTVSGNAAANLQRRNSLNELIAEVLLQSDKQTGKDPVLLQLVGDMFHDD